MDDAKRAQLRLLKARRGRPAVARRPPEQRGQVREELVQRQGLARSSRQQFALQERQEEQREIGKQRHEPQPQQLQEARQLERRREQFRNECEAEEQRPHPLRKELPAARTGKTLRSLPDRRIEEEHLRAARTSDERFGKKKSGEPKFRHVVVWKCKDCQKECIPVREQSRCICGHRLHSHKERQTRDGKVRFPCVDAKCKCSCPNFFLLPSQGHWIVRCACKHTGVMHDPKTHACMRPNCKCKKFHSPWVCNCDHPFESHACLVERRQVKTLAEMFLQGDSDLCIGGDDVRRTDLFNEPLQM